MKKIPLILLLCLIFGVADAQITINFTPFADGFNSPLDIQNVGDDRLFIVEQGGRIKILNADGTTNPTPFLDISSLVSNGSEQGLLGLAFHPDYATNGYFYVNYTKINGNTRIARFSVDPTDPNIALFDSDLTMIEYDQPFSNHNGGGITFGPDGFLYIATGDGGSGGDPGNRAQNTELLLGKLLRIDIDFVGGSPYSIPPTNPFAGDPSKAEEIWAYGLRNPFRFSFDSLTNDLWIGDVGQNDVEEIDRVASTEAGVNYGWRCYEGSEPFNTTGCPDPSVLEFPIAEYSSASGSGNCSVTGGIVYRGTAYPNEYGLYFAGDVCSQRIFTVDDAGTLIDHGSKGGSWVGFGVDKDQELYAADIGGTIYKFEGTILGVNDFDAAEIAMTPNPANDQITVTLENSLIASILVSDIKGSLLISEENLSENSKTLSVSSLSSGLYIVKIATNDGKSAFKKLIIK